MYLFEQNVAALSRLDWPLHHTLQMHTHAHMGADRVTFPEVMRKDKMPHACCVAKPTQAPAGPHQNSRTSNSSSGSHELLGSASVKGPINTTWGGCIRVSRWGKAGHHACIRACRLCWHPPQFHLGGMIPVPQPLHSLPCAKNLQRFTCSLAHTTSALAKLMTASACCAGPIAAADDSENMVDSRPASCCGSFGKTCVVERWGEQSKGYSRAHRGAAA